MRASGLKLQNKEWNYGQDACIASAVISMNFNNCENTSDKFENILF